MEVEVVGAQLALSFAYHPGWVAGIKSLRRRTWQPDARRWLVPAEDAAELLAALEAAGAPVEALRPHAAEAIAEAARLGARARRAWEGLAGLDARRPDLFAHQREGVRFLLTPRAGPGAGRGVILADEMGLGKTRQAIVAAHEAAPAGPHLVLCPAALTHHWAREIARAGAEAAAWTVVSYDGLHRRPELAERSFVCCILDEAHYAKNPRARRSKLAAALAARAERRWLLTGTPVANRPLDLFQLLRLIDHPLGDDRLAFGLRYCAAHFTPSGWDMRGASNLGELRDRLAPVLLRRTKEEVLDLPPKLRTYVPVEVDLAAYRRVWTAHVERMVAAAKGKKRIPRRLLLAEIAKLRHAAALAKIPAALDLAEGLLEAEAKAVVFTCHRAVVAAFVARFGAAAVRVVGGQSARTRQAAIDAFERDPAVRLLVGDVRAAGHGFTLAAASQVVFVDYAWTPAAHLQAEDRAHRIGQTRGVTVTYMSAVGTIDEDVEALLAQKLDVAARLVDGADGPARLSFLDDLLAIVERATPDRAQA